MVQKLLNTEDTEMSKSLSCAQQLTIYFFWWEKQTLYNSTSKIAVPAENRVWDGHNYTSLLASGFKKSQWAA